MPWWSVDFQTFALIVIAAAALVFLVLVALIVFVAVRYRASIGGVLGLLAGAGWVASPIDPIPEAVFGPLGLADDTAVIIAMALYITRLVARHRQSLGPGPGPGTGPGPGPGPRVIRDDRYP